MSETRATSIRRTFLFVCGLVVIAGASWRFLRDGGHAPALAFLSALAMLVADYLLPSGDLPSREELESMTGDELRIAARQRGIPRFSSMAKSALVDAIVTAQNAQPSWATRWNGLRWCGFAFSIGIGVSLNWFFPNPARSKPQIEVAWYSNSEDGPVIADPQNIELQCDIEDLLQRKLRIPIQFAVRNQDPEPMKVVRIEIRYPKGLEVSSEAKAKIDPAGRVVVYEHNIGTLEPVNDFTPLETVDVLTIPYFFAVYPVVAFTNDGVPFYSVVDIPEGAFRQKRIELGVRLFCDGRPRLEGRLSFGVDADVDLTTDFDGGELAKLEASDQSYFELVPGATDVELRWSREVTPASNDPVQKTRTVEYTRATTSLGVVQLINVDDVRRKVFVDSNSDGECDFVLMDSKGDGRADLKGVFTGERRLMYDWSPEAAR